MWMPPIVSWSRFYEGANRINRERTTLTPLPRDTRQDLTPIVRSDMAGIARFLYANVGFVRGAINDIARYSVGSGIRCLSTIPERDVAQEHDEYWEAWCANPEVRARFTFTALLNRMSRAVDVDGDIGVSRVVLNGEPRIQVWESHRIGDPTGSPEFQDGVRLGQFGEALAYRIIKGPNETDTLDIPGSAFYLLMDPDRVDQSRGASGLKHAILDLRDSKDILAYEKQGVKASSAIALVVKQALANTGKGFFSQQSTETTSSSATLTLEQLFGGTIPKLAPNEDISSFSYNRPSMAFHGFLGRLDRSTAVGLGVPVEFVWDSSTVGGATQRFVLQKAQRRFDERMDMLIPFIGWCRRFVTAVGITNRSIRAHHRSWTYTYQGPAKITVDVGREAAANRDDVRGGLRTIQEDYSERGVNWLRAREDNERAAVDLLERAVALVAKFPEQKIPLDAAVKMLEDRTPAQIIFSPPEPAQPERTPNATPSRP